MDVRTPLITQEQIDTAQPSWILQRYYDLCDNGDLPSHDSLRCWEEFQEAIRALLAALP